MVFRVEIKVSVILTTFNGATRGYLNEAIESVLSQTFKNFELILVDDGSTDKTKSFCSGYLNDARVKYVYQMNKGLAAARNTGIRHSNGDYVCFLDDDDVWNSGKLEKQVSLFEGSNDPKIGMVFTALEKIDENGKYQGVNYNPAEGNIYNKIIYCGNVITGPSSVMIKRKALEKAGVFDEFMKSAEDLELWSRIAKEFSIYSIKDPLVKYRIHSNRITHNSCKRENFYEYFFYFQLLAREPSIDEDQVFYNLFHRHTIKHFSLGNYKDARKTFIMSWAYKTPKLYLWGLYFLSFFPRLADSIKEIRKKNIRDNFCDEN